MNLKMTTIKQKVVVPATPEEIYDAFMDAKKHTQFTGSKATCNPKVGGKFTAWDDYIQGKNLELEKGKRIIQEWTTTEWPKGYPPSRVELTFQEVKEGTEITMVHSNVPQEQSTDYEQGWIDYYWNPLKQYFKK
jgi:activator of HSP90 ATPase